ncbi:MYG1 family protein [Persicobacter psychrovividus]|uniref:Uncharacterized protein n=1 Tax=Persicobacter psychrovividus TaxID=387638 RepID=A0ABM7VM61_9BACT|nr:hypothetical protein PEPS_43480 [Persicobacter psychrovividus]
MIHTFITHRHIFHADDVLSFALVRKYINPELKLKRMAHYVKSDALDAQTIMVDVGRKYDGKQYFDHHQDSHLPASCVLILDIIPIDELLKDFFKSKMRVVSDTDRGLTQNKLAHMEVDMGEIISLNKIIKSFNRQPKDHALQKQQFLMAADLCDQLIDNWVHEFEYQPKYMSLK